MKLIYGSTAIKYWFPDFDREPQDLDYIFDGIFPERIKGVEYYWCSAFSFLVLNKDTTYVDPDFLYTIKVAHLSWDINWNKHMRDVIFLKSKGCKLNKEFYDLLMIDFSEFHGKKKVKMNVMNEEFFKPNIKRMYDHDWLHEQLALGDEPMHFKIRKDKNKPLCSKELWDKLSFEDKMNCVTEELSVLTAERFILVDEQKIKTNIAVTLMLKNMITSTTSGWFNLFLKENFEQIKNIGIPNNLLKRIEGLKK